MTFEVDYLQFQNFYISESEPPKVEGTLWHQPSTGLWRQYKSGSWQIAIPLVVSDTEPSVVIDGLLWYDTLNDALKIYDAGSEQFIDIAQNFSEIIVSQNIVLGNVDLRDSSLSTLRIGNSNGYVIIGPENTSYCHFKTDRSKFYFTVGMEVNGNIYPVLDATNRLGYVTRRWLEAYITNLYVDLLTPISPDYTISNNIYASNDAEETITPNLTWVVAKTFTLPSDFPTNTTLRIYFEMRLNPSYAWNQAQGVIRRNGVDVGTIQTNSTTTYIAFTEDIAGWGPGDVIELAVTGLDGSDKVDVRNFRILGDGASTQLTENKYNITPG